MIRSHRRTSRGCAARLQVEQLESRTLCAVNVLPGTHPSLDLAQSLGDVSSLGTAAATGTIINEGNAGGVDWFSFQLDRPAHVELATSSATLDGILSLYGPVTNDPGFYADGINRTYDPLGQELLAQDDGGSGNAVLDRDLAPGTWFVAISGHGDSYFNPYLANSGYPGSTGAYQLTVSATDLPASPGPVVLASNPADGAQLSSSPFVIRVDLSAPPAPDALIPGQTIRLMYSQDGTFTDGQPDVSFTAYFSTVGDEIQLTPEAPLVPGCYRLFLAGSAGSSPSIVAGADYTATFQITGNEGGPANGPGNETWATATDLGNITSAGLVQQVGAIGANSADPVPFDPNAVDFYHFQISGPGLDSFAAEVFAGRIGSPLDPGVSLFQLDPTSGQLQFISANDNTQNASVASDPNQTLVLYNDSALFANLSAGDYYIAVSSSLNVPDPTLGLAPGTMGVFDPNAPAWPSGVLGYSTGPYVLNLMVQPSPPAPQPVAVFPANNSILNGPPQQIVVQLDQPLNSQQVQEQAFQQDQGLTPDAVYIVGGPQNQTYVPRLENYDPTTNQVTFQMLDGLPQGQYQLYVNGPMVGSYPPNLSSASVYSFIVQGPMRGIDDDGRQWADSGALGSTDVIGPLFPNELAGTGVTVARTFSADTTANPTLTDTFQLTLLEGQSYQFNLTTTGPSAGGQLTLIPNSGVPVAVSVQNNQAVLLEYVPAGTYTVTVGGWTVLPSSYQIGVVMLGQHQDPAPLTVGPAPAIRIRLVLAPNPTQPSGNDPASSTVPTLPPPNRLLLNLPPDTTDDKGNSQSPTAPGPDRTAPVRSDDSASASVFSALAMLPLGGVRGTVVPAESRERIDLSWARNSMPSLPTPRRP